MEQNIERLKQLYANASKHSNYQILAENLSKAIGNNDIVVKSRYERERLNYILSQLQPNGKRILDVGGNTGFFTFEMLNAGASSVVLIEGNKEHAEFVEEASKLLGYDSKLKIINKYLSFDNELDTESFDVILLLNVLHHVGDDYGDKNISVEKAKQKIIESINIMADKTRYMIFQLGFCWKGNRNLLLFENGTKKEMIDFITAGISDSWEIINIAVAETIDGRIIYKELNNINILRNDSLGEFLNRPLFLLKSKSSI